MFTDKKTSRISKAWVKVLGILRSNRKRKYHFDFKHSTATVPNKTLYFILEMFSIYKLTAKTSPELTLYFGFQGILRSMDSIMLSFVWFKLSSLQEKRRLFLLYGSWSFRFRDEHFAKTFSSKPLPWFLGIYFGCDWKFNLRVVNDALESTILAVTRICIALRDRRTLTAAIWEESKMRIWWRMNIGRGVLMSIGNDPWEMRLDEYWGEWVLLI